MSNQEILKRSRILNIRIRRFARSKQIYDYRLTGQPLGGSIKDSIGPFPEYLLHGVKCLRSESGYCSPCGYSLDGYPIEKAKEKCVENSIHKQAMRIVKDFDRLVMKKQFRVFQSGKEKRIYFVVTAVGSFFSDNEVPLNIKSEMLSKLQALVKDSNMNVWMFVETRPEDVITYVEQGKIGKICDSLIDLNTTVLFGFESINETIRNLDYLKNLSLETFENAVKLLQNYGIRNGAFVFVGGHSLTQTEIVKDFENTVSYLYSRRIMPVVMVENLKKCTINHLLYLLGQHRLVEPRTSLKILEILRAKQVDLSPEPWLVADPVGGPPEPAIHSFKNDKMRTCNDCAGNILGGLRYIRKTYRWNDFDVLLHPEIDDCNCIEDYRKLIELESNLSSLPLEQRIFSNVKFAEQNLNKYFALLKNNSEVKTGEN